MKVEPSTILKSVLLPILFENATLFPDYKANRGFTMGAVPSKRALKLNLAQFDLYEGRGFLPERSPWVSPYTLAFHQVRPWGVWVQKTACQLSKLLVTKHARKVIAGGLETLTKQGELDFESFASQIPFLDKRVLNALMRDVSFVGNAWVWGSKYDIEENNPAKSIPPGIAVPWCLLAKELGTTPTLSYAWYCLNNWQTIGEENSRALPTLENSALINNFLGGLDEEGFVKIHLVIENEWGSLPSNAISAMQAVAGDDAKALETALWEIGSAQIKATQHMYKMWDWCGEQIYYDRVRLHIAGWLHNPALPQGVIYEGVSEFEGKPQQFGGETGAQSSGVPLQYAVLDIRHKEDVFFHDLMRMRGHMPRGHREFIEAIENLSKEGVSVRTYVEARKATHASLREMYRRCFDALVAFLEVHYRFVDYYVVRQTQKLVHNPTGRGTGATIALSFLRGHIDRVKEIRDSM